MIGLRIFRSNQQTLLGTRDEPLRMSAGGPAGEAKFKAKLRKLPPWLPPLTSVAWARSMYAFSFGQKVLS